MTQETIPARIAEELGVNHNQVAAAVKLLDEGATVPFIARYRKEATGGLDDSQLRTLEERLGYLREMEERKETVIKAIDEQGKLTAELAEAIRNAATKTRVEDLYRPYQKKRRTKAQIAREAGLEPLADSLLNDPSQDPQQAAAAFVTTNAETTAVQADATPPVADADAALEGARQILMERFAENADLIAELRDYGWQKGYLVSRVAAEQQEQSSRFRDYFDHTEALHKIPSHRALAMLRGQSEEVLRLHIAWSDAEARGEEESSSVGERAIARHFGIAEQGRPSDEWLARTVRLAWRAKLAPHLELALKRQLREQAEEEAIRVFGANLEDLLLAAPAGPRPTLGLDPGLRTGVKVAVIDATGAVADTATIYPFAAGKDLEGSLKTLAELARRHEVGLVAIGNGTASRETDALVGELIKRHPDLGLHKVMVSEAGASVYSASEQASRELPELDVAMRGAVSIARRLQDPLAELVKIEPKSIGVGQYQHDVNQSRLNHKLSAVVEDCVNAVGVDANTASAALLARVSGLGPNLAEKLVSHRFENGAFRSRKDLQKVPRLGPKAFEQAAGFLRIPQGDNPLDASAVHPEAYPVIERICAQTGRQVSDLIGDEAFLKTLKPRDFTDDNFGEPTVRDILQELAKPGRDPRPEFRTAAFREGVETLADLEEGMVLEGTVTNVANFGAFVDIGVHQDGLVHISALAHEFVRDPRDVVRTGDVVKVKVLEVDQERRRIGLSMRLDDQPGDGEPRGAASKSPGKGPDQRRSGASANAGKGKKKAATAENPSASKRGGRASPQEQAPTTALAEAFRKAK
ncbi:S1 RNA-binding domain [Halorhodospira halochloris]|uniref:S1 RNA-binding domain n=1 Tax=Halorhodospira halochloris TaxID=1052 RepID=A0A0X8X765_HALHR|nr:Tex family protein [Halorhodospira halochloris]MBK1650629.1 RNA-binding transcriptional accessory protein [Halorhodospira halochloris]BAU56887.1 S1 RNA-binding domain [Halorhodospira halochloris]